MKKNTINEQFESAAKHFESVYNKKFGRGFQARVSEKSGVRASYFNEILSGKKEGTEEIRRKLVEGITNVSDLKEGNLTYDNFLNLGQYIINNGTATGWKPLTYEPTTLCTMEETTGIYAANTKTECDINKLLVTKWINMQDEPSDYWVLLKLVLSRESPEFKEWLKNISLAD